MVIMTFPDLFEWYSNLNPINEALVIILGVFIIQTLIYYIYYLGKSKFFPEDEVDTLPSSIHTQAIMTSQLIQNNADPKLIHKSLPDQIMRLRRELRYRHLNKVLIPITDIPYSQVPEEIISEYSKVCFICRKVMDVGDNVGFYQCCYEMTHYEHVLIWHQVKRTCPFCRQYPVFSKIISN